MNGAPPSPKALLDRFQLRAKKHFGQNFLADARLAARIAELATDPPGGTVVEIGAGLGALTAPLLARASLTVAIERDRDLVPALESRFADAIAESRLRVVEADAKRVDYAELLAGPAPRVLAGNLPYQLTGPLLEIAVGLARQVARVVVLVQLEVGERLAAHPGTSAYGALTVFVQAQYQVHRAFVVRRGAFYPQPGVDSAVIVLDPLAQPITEETPLFQRIVHAAFAQRRKKLRNAWRAVSDLETGALESAASRAGIDLEARGETLTPADFARMSLEVAR
jgi:16S rRNA (adenine1518-N6/adenine1519-N6)-dimethyltransferase